MIARQADLADAGYGGLAATDAQLLRKFVRQLGGWTRRFAVSLLSDGDQEFDELSEINAFGTFLNAYSEIEAELPTVELKPSERGRLWYALKALSGRDE